MAKRLPVSFKENDRDLRLYSYVMNEDDKSCFIKKAIEFYIDNLNPKSITVSKKDYTEVESESICEIEDDGIGEILGFN